jgi:predicted alpha/beta hydrolase family esterase
MALLFLHGAGGFDEDRPLADALGEELGEHVVYPEFSADDMAYEDQAPVTRAALDAIGSDDRVVAHSFGASILLRVLAEHDRPVPRRVVLLAMPDWSPRGWDYAEYAFTATPPPQEISLHHCRDDEVVEFEHLALAAALLPAATVHAHATGGHQFDGRVVEIAADVRG